MSPPPPRLRPLDRVSAWDPPAGVSWTDPPVATYVTYDDDLIVATFADGRPAVVSHDPILRPRPNTRPRRDRPMTTTTPAETDALTAEADAAELQLDETNTHPDDVTDAACAHTTRFPREALRSLGSCGPYLRTHAELFPTSRFPKGPALTAAVCAAHADSFDWDWAASNMLTYAGRDEWDRVRGSRAQRYQHLGTGPTRRAAAFGYVYETHPEYRNERVVEACRTAAARLDDRLLRDVDDARSEVQRLEQLLETTQLELDRRRAELPAVEARAAAARRRQARRRLAERETTLAELERRATEAAARLERERAQLAADRAALEEAAAAPPVEVPPVEVPPVTGTIEETS